MSRIPIPHYYQPGGYHFIDRSTGVPVRIEGTSYDDVAAKVLKFRLANGKDPGNPIAELYEYACSSAPYICKEASPAVVSPRNSGGSGGGGSLATRVAVWFSGFYRAGGAADRGAQTAETERRANICAECPRNQPITGCGACVDGLARLFFVWRRDRHIPREREVAQSGCLVIGQHNGVAVLARDLPPLTVETKQKLPPRCWRK